MTQNTIKVQVGLYSFEYKEWLRTIKNSSLPSGYVYLVHAIGTNRYKIGRTNDLIARLRQLQGQSAYPLKILRAFKTINPAWDEAYWQKKYQKKRVYGEWFEFSPDDIWSLEGIFLSEYEWRKINNFAAKIAEEWDIDWSKLDHDFKKEPLHCFGASLRTNIFHLARKLLGLQGLDIITFKEVQHDTQAK
jgi:hypothetical protein